MSHPASALLVVACIAGLVACTGAEAAPPPRLESAGGSSGASGASESPGDDGAPDAAPDGAPVETFDAYCASYAAAYCNKALGCAPYALHAVYPDVAACRASNTTQCKTRLAASGAAKPNAGCPLALAAESCDDFLSDRGQIEACNVHGKRALGGACAYSEQCASGACRVVTDGCGSCVAAVQENGDCSKGEVCAPRLLCAALDPASASARCVRYRGRNEACGPTLPPCLASLTCATSGTCVDASPLGASCDPGSGGCSSAAGLYCAVTDSGKGAGVCRSIELGKPDDACSYPALDCGAGSTCSSFQGGTCIASLPLGAACSAQQGPRCARPGECILGRCAIANPACL